jgi:hypothetical protein
MSTAFALSPYYTAHCGYQRILIKLNFLTLYKAGGALAKGRRAGWENQEIKAGIT